MTKIGGIFALISGIIGTIIFALWVLLLLIALLARNEIGTGYYTNLVAIIAVIGLIYCVTTMTLGLISIGISQKITKKTRKTCAIIGAIMGGVFTIPMVVSLLSGALYVWR